MCRIAAAIRIVSASATVLFASLASASASSQEMLIHVFTGVDGAEPYAGTLISDRAGNLYGTTAGGGDFGDGVVFQLGRSGDSWVETVLYSFRGGSDGVMPDSGVTFDGASNLYGTTTIGGAGCQNVGCGTVYRLHFNGQSWSENIIYRFRGGADGDVPLGGVAFDPNGNLYGTTESGGRCGGVSASGTIYQLKRVGSSWNESVIHRFCRAGNGYDPGYGNLIVDSKSNLYGVAPGGSNGNGVVFRLSPTTSGGWTYAVIHRFTNREGFVAPDGMTPDGSGGFFGTTDLGGLHGFGTVWHLIQTAPDAWSLDVLYDFRGGAEGYNAFSPPIFDSSGNLYGATYNGGISGNGCFNACGTFYELAPQLGGGWRHTILHDFGNPATDGYNPIASPIIDNQGHVFGTTTKGGGGLTAAGTIYEVVP